MHGNGPSRYKNFLAGLDLDKQIYQTNKNCTSFKATWATLQIHSFVQQQRQGFVGDWWLTAGGKVSLFSSLALGPYLCCHLVKEVLQLLMKTTFPGGTTL
jgi:hypothetical protein